MKNIAIMGLAALLLFSVSTGISLWLDQQSKAKEAAAEKGEHKKSKDKDKDKHGDDDHGNSTKSKDSHTASTHGSTSNSHTPSHDTTSHDTIVSGGIRDREARLEKRQAQEALIIADMRADRELLEKLSKQVNAETKAALADAQSQVQAKSEAPVTAATTPPAATTPTDVVQTSANRKVNKPDPKDLAKRASIWDAMPADTVASQVQTMSERGEMELAAQILSLMNIKQVAKVFVAIPDQVLANQLMARIKPAETGTTSK